MGWFSSDDWYNDNSPRYKKQMENVEYLVLDTIQKKKEVNINMDDLRSILDALWEWRLID